MANKKISELTTRTPSLSDLMLVGDPSSGYSFKCTVTALATIIETDIADGYVTLGTAQTISGAKTFSNNLTLTSVSNAGVDTDKFLVLSGSNVVNFRTGAEVLSDIGAQAALTNPITGTGTLGQVAYFNGTNSITSSSNFVWDNANSRLGVGGSPGAFTLDITGTGRASTTFEIGTSTIWQRFNNNSISYFSQGSYFNTLSTNAPGTLNYVNGTSGNTIFSFLNNATLRINTILSGAVAGLTYSQLALDASLFGISTTTPAITNRVYTTSGSAISVQRLNLYNGDAGKIEMQPTGGNVLIGTTTDAGFRLDVNGTARTQQQHTFLQGTSLDATGASYFHSVPTGGSTYGGLALRNQTQDYTGYIFTGRSGAANAIAFTHTTFAGTPTGSGVTISQLFKNSTSDFGNGNVPHVVTIWASTSGSPTITNSLVLRGNLNTTNTGHAIAFNHLSGDVTTNVTASSIQSVKQNLGGAFITTSMRFLTISDGANTLGEKMRITDAGTFQTNASVTAASSLAQGASVINTLVAAANNDVLVGLDINPTFTNGAFTGVANAGLRSSSWLFVNSSSAGIVMGSGITFNPSGTPINGFILNPNGVYYRGSGSGFTHSFRTNSNDASGERLRLTDANVMMLNTNVLVNTTTDAGFRLDVNGTARVQGATTISTGGADITGGLVLSGGGNFTMRGGAFGSTKTITFQTEAANNTIGSFLISQNGGNRSILYFYATASTDGGFLKLEPGLSRAITAKITGGQANNGSQDFFQVQAWNATPETGAILASIGNLGQGRFGQGTNEASAVLQANSTTAGFLNARMTTAQRDAISTPATGLSVYNTSTNTNDYYNGSAWLNVGQVLVPANNTTGFSISGSSLTGSNAQSLVSLSQTWNTTGNPTAFLLNITNTASGATADLMELQVGGVAQFIVGKSGTIQTTAPAGGTAAAWKLGTVASVSPTSPNRTIEVEVGGTTYYLHAKTTND